MERLAKEICLTATYEWNRAYLSADLGRDHHVIVFPLCVLSRVLVLTALYESWTLPTGVVRVCADCAANPLFSACGLFGHIARVAT